MAVALINSWDEFDEPHEHLRDAGVLRRWLYRNGFERASQAVVDDDLDRARDLRGRLTAAFDVPSEEDAVRVLNAVVEEFGTTPALERGQEGWRFRSWPDESEGLRFLAAFAALGLLEAIRDLGWERFGRCAGSPCRCVYLDRSRNHSRRYCGHLCADRVSQANYRRRRRS